MPDGAESGRQLHILLVEDHEDTALMTTEYLELCGHYVRTARSVREVAEAVAAERFDVLISDLGLPDGSGIDALRAMRAGGSEAVAIALSGSGMDEDRTKTTAAGFVEHLLKPVDVRHLEAAIRRITRA